jgi:hypothetical protein
MKLLPAAIAQCHRSVLFDNSYRPAPGAQVEMVPFQEIRRDDQMRVLFPLPEDMLEAIWQKHPHRNPPRWAIKYLDFGPRVRR